MGIRQFKPVTSSTRFRSVSDFADVTRSEPERSLLEPLRQDDESRPLFDELKAMWERARARYPA